MNSRLVVLSAAWLALPLAPCLAEDSHIAEIRAKAEHGEVEAELRLAEWYYGGWGVPLDYTEAMKWYRKAAEQGNAKAQCGIGSMYNFGRGT
jgi:TPR repeat protein